MKWTKKGFDDFRKGTFGNSGQNLYVSKGGTLQRIFNFDINGDGYFDLPIANSHAMNEKPPLYVYDSLNQEKPLELPTNGSFNAIFADITGDGTDDLIVACQHNGVHSDVAAVIYYGSEQGLCEKYRTELLCPSATMVAAGDFNGNGRTDLVFSTKNRRVRVFTATALGIEPTEYKDIEIPALAFASGDLDGDGYDDLYVLCAETGDLAVYWGSPEGLNPENKTVFANAAIPDDSRATSTTAGRMMCRWFPWMVSVIKTKDKIMTFRAEGDYAVFESFEKDRKSKEEMRIFCTKQNLHKDLTVDAVFMGNGAVHACCGDLRNNGSCDIVIAVATEFETYEDAIVLWESEGYNPEKATRIPLPCARNVSVGSIGSDPKNYLFVTMGCEADNLEIPARIFSFDKDGNATEVCQLPAMEANRVISGKTYTDGRHQLVIVNHEGERHLGLEYISFFLGGEDGFDPQRRVDLPSCAAVDCVPVDLNDDGQPEIIVANCSENAPQCDPGAAIYWGKDGRFDPENANHFNCRTSHGCALGDFRKCGYIDLIFTGLGNRKICYFKGGPNGYDFENPEYILVGPEKDKIEYFPRAKGLELEERDPEERKRCREFGGARWIFSADLNNDGWLDLIVPQITGPRAFIFWGGPDGFSDKNSQTLAVDGAAMANAADLDGDGYIDLVFACHMSLGHTYPAERGKFVIYWGSKDGYSENRKTYLPSYCANSVTIQDFNNDGRLDIYGTAYNNGRLRDIDSKMYFQGEDGMFHLADHQLIFNNSGCGCLAGDFNGDGYIDLAVASHKKDGNHVAESFVFWGGEDGINETRFTALPSIGPHGICTADIGNIMDRSNSEYYYSEAYKTDTRATRVSWVASNGKKTWVRIQFRCADTPRALESTEWSESYENGADISALNLKGYIQYKLELGAYCGIGTPRVTEVTIDFE